MPASQDWIDGAYMRAEELTALGVFWRHDGNSKRPYARLASGKISNGYFNGALVEEQAFRQRQFASELSEELIRRGSRRIDRVVAPAMGAITLGFAVASTIPDHDDRMEPKFSFAEKDGTGGFEFKRNPPQPGENLLVVEDTITTGGSALRVKNATLNLVPSVTFVPFILSLCNRSGELALDGMEIISYVDGDFTVWQDGKNPFTPDGTELVPPVEKVKENWGRLTRPYP